MCQLNRSRRRTLYQVVFFIAGLVFGLTVTIVPITLIVIQTNDQYFQAFMTQYELMWKHTPRPKSIYKYEKFVEWNRTLCSKKSDDRGPHQKVIAISMYGKESKFTDNPMFSWENSLINFLKPLADEINILLPEWILRIYIDFAGSTKSQQEFLYNFSNIDICDINELPMFGTAIRSFLPGKMWRFLPIFDPYVDYLLSRDLDSPITQREIQTVNIWLSDDEKQNYFYMARDNIQHGVPILGGLWGAAMIRARYELYQIFQPLLIPSISRHYTGNGDQIFLTDYVWRLIENNATTFDSYSCRELKGRPFPSQRPISSCYLGCLRPCCNEKIKSNFNVTIEPCPIECRPKKHLDWIYC